MNLIFAIVSVNLCPMFFMIDNQTMRFYSGYITNGITNLSIMAFPLMVVFLLVTGVGLLLKKKWGLKGAIATAYFVLVVNSFAMIAVMMTVSIVRDRNALTSSIVGGIVGSILSLLYPCATLIFLNRPSVKAAVTEQLKENP